MAVLALVASSLLVLVEPANAAGAPDTKIKKGPTGTVASTTATFAFKAKPQKGATFKCRMDTGKWKRCASPTTYSGLGQGGHMFAVRAKANGAQDKTPATRAFTVDTVPPTVTVTDGPAGFTPDSTPTFAFSANGPAAFTCRIGEGAFVPCASPYTPAAPLVDGEYTFQVRARDAVGNVGTASRAFEVLTPLTYDLATAQAAAAYLLPDTTDIDIAANCSGDIKVDCPDGVTPLPPADQVHLVSTRSVTEVVGQSRFDLDANIGVTTLVPIKVTYMGATCDLTATSAATGLPVWRLTGQLNFVHPPSSSEWRIQTSNTNLTQVEDGDLSISGAPIACNFLASSIGFFKDLLIDQLASQFLVTLCAARGPDYLGPCPTP